MGKMKEKHIDLMNLLMEQHGALRDCTEQLRLYLESVEHGKDDDAESAYQHGFAVLERTEAELAKLPIAEHYPLVRDDLKNDELNENIGKDSVEALYSDGTPIFPMRKSGE